MKARLFLGVVCCILSAGAEAPPAASTGPVSPPSLRIVVDVIEATVDPAAAMMDIQSIDPKRHDVAKILARLGQYGQAELATRFDGQITPGNSISLSSGQRAPVPTGVTFGPNGKRMSYNVDYRDIGSIVQATLSPATGTPGYLLQGNLEWSGVGASGVPLSDNLSAPVILKTSMRISSTILPDTPILVSRALRLPDQLDGSKKAQIIVFRIVLNPSAGEPDDMPVSKKR